MGTVYNIYCDESCHLEHDGIPIMSLSAVWCPFGRVKEISRNIRRIKARYSATGELKWKKVSLSKLPFYRALVDYFFSENYLNFRCLVVAPKNRLNHSYFNLGSHDSFYYKMYYQLLLNIVSQPKCLFNIYLDFKDTHGGAKAKKLREVLHNKLNTKDLVIQKIQLVRSHESELIQLSDFLVGALCYCNRDDIPKENRAKLDIVQRIKSGSGTDLTHTSPPWEEKFNLFIFQPRKTDEKHKS